MTTEQIIKFIKGHYDLIVQAEDRQEAQHHRTYIRGLLAMASLTGIISPADDRDMYAEVQSL